MHLSVISGAGAALVKKLRYWLVHRLLTLILTPLKTRIFIVDDHAVFRKGLLLLINAEPDMEVCGEGEDCIRSTQNILRLKPDLVVVDICLKGSDGLELIKNIKVADPKIHAIAFSMRDEAVYALRVLRAGGKGYVMKRDAVDSILRAIRTVRAGRLYVSDVISSQLLNQYAEQATTSGAPATNSLSDRELEVVNLIGEGLPTAQIAKRMNLSIKTVETHRSRIKTKLGLGSGMRLIQFCIRWVDRIPGAAQASASRPAAPINGAVRQPELKDRQYSPLLSA